MNIARCLRCRVLGLTLLYRWITQHIASCPPTGVMCCALTSCVQSLAVRGPLVEETGETKWTFSLVAGPPVVNLGGFPLGAHLDLIIGEGVATFVGVHPTQALHSTPWGPARWVGRKTLATVAAPSSPTKLFFLIPLLFFEGPTSGHHDVFSRFHYRAFGRIRADHLDRHVFLVSKRTLCFFWVLVVWMLHIW